VSQRISYIQKKKKEKERRKKKPLSSANVDFQDYGPYYNETYS
jgi:hypothetical protein